MDTLRIPALLATQNYAKILPLAGLMVLCTFMPNRTQNFQIRNISKALVIQTSKVEPPRVAFDEIVGSHSNTKMHANEWNLLRSSSAPAVNLNQQSRISPKFSGLEIIKNRKVVLKEMSFGRDVALQEIEVQREKQVEMRQWLAGLDPKDQMRMMAAQQNTQVLDQDWSAPDYRAEAQSLIQQAQQEIQAEETASNNKIQVSYTTPSGEVKTEASRSRPQVAINDGRIAVAGEEKGFAETTSYVVAGTVSLPLGGPLLPGYHVEVSRFEDGAKKETVPVDLRSNKYNLAVSDLNGAIVAQLLDAQGEVVGEGSRRISKYDVAQLKNLPLIKMQSRQSSVSGVVASFDGGSSLTSGIQGKEKGIKANILYASLDTEGATDESGSFQINQLMKGSWSLMRTSAKGYYPALFMGEAGDDRKLPVFTNKMINALRQIVSDQKVMSDVAETGSVVWGQITQDGKSIAGVEVDVEFLSQHKAVYFNSLLIPDPSLKATSENGYFAILNLPAGFHSLIASRGEQYFSHSNVVVDDDSISIAEIKSAIKKDLIQLKVFDAFTGNPGSAELQMQSLPSAIEVNGIASLDLPDVSRLSFLTARPNSDMYVPTLQVYNDADEYVHVPLINKAWLESVRSAQKINYIPDSSTVIGFVESEDYDVYLPHSENYAQDNRIFFDAQGQLSQKSVVGGGFILFNVPPGVQSVVVVQQQSDMMNSQIIPADENSTVVLKVRF